MSVAVAMILFGALLVYGGWRNLSLAVFPCIHERCGFSFIPCHSLLVGIVTAFYMA